MLAFATTTQLHNYSELGPGTSKDSFSSNKLSFLFFIEPSSRKRHNDERRTFYRYDLVTGCSVNITGDDDMIAT